MKLKVTYAINESLLHILTEMCSSSKQQVWANLQDLTHKCFKRLETSEKSRTWTVVQYPNTDIKLRIKVEQHKWDSTAISGNVSIRLHNKRVEFTSKQVEDFLVENVLLGFEP